MGVYGGCGLWFDHPCAEAKPFVCEFADDGRYASSSSSKKSEEASGASAGLIVTLVMVALLLLGAAGAYLYKKRNEAVTGYGNAARSYMPPSSNLPSYEEYVFNPTLELGSPQGI